MAAQISDGYWYRFCIAFLMMLIVTPLGYAAETFPSKPLRMLVPTPPGGTIDTLARAIGRRLTERWGEQVVVDNRAGGHGIIAMQMLANSPSDGHTLMIGTIGTIAINPGLYSKLPYNTLLDFQPVSLLTKQAFLLAIPASFPAKSVTEFIKIVKSHPGKYNYGSGGNGSGNHVAMEMLKHKTGLDIVHVPYKGGMLVINDLSAGNVQAFMTGVFALMPHVKLGKIRALAVTNNNRLAIAPEIPTFTESGVKGFEISQWQGMLAPAGVPAPVLEKIYGAVRQAMQAPEIQKPLIREGAEVVATTPKVFGEFIRSEISLWTRVIKDSGITVD